MRTIIVGGGLTGLILAYRLAQASRDEVLILEKSRGVGGRMATRRTEHAAFDHGAQFYAARPPLEALHRRWQAASLSEPWFTRDEVAHFAANAGMTALAKDLARDLNVQFETLVEKFSFQDGRWHCRVNNGPTRTGERLILTAPLPQSLTLLRDSGVAYDPKLEKITYSKAVVALIELDSQHSRVGGETGYAEFAEGPVFSIADQRRKGTSSVPAATVTLSEATSETLFESADETAGDLITREFARLEPEAWIRALQIKKWRYNKPNSTFGAMFTEVAPALFLAGDAFGGASLNGAARSANALFEAIAPRY